ncbi:coiled-coil domain-containing protein lobo isoform X1 [Drosophila elegans]|uniref:coiled-coil domain-containing protein lobo isoform X1 n=1 Tax=Drosophila elegans TaxID=30023 RepID=UPI001BC861AA|nr:coiled-coil domain-containing protein lobo isoform X1 [Drosophila elegans]
MPKVLFQKYKKVVSNIDPSRHSDKFKEIDEFMRSQATESDFVDEMEGEYEVETEEMKSSEFSLSEGEPALNIGKIDLSFPETIEEFENSPQCYPPSYYTLSPKERLLLLYAENFRKQLVLTYPKKRAMVLALPNECKVQKFVCTTIRPTAFIHTELISSVEEIAKFVADFVQYEPLDDPINLPNRLISPDTLLRRRKGNSYEMATLLASMLIGAGHPALVVSGVAREETILNDQLAIPYPYPIVEVEAEEIKPKVEKPGQKYKLRGLPDLESHLEAEMAEVHRQKAAEEKRIQDEIIRKQMEELELLAVDRHHYRRCHAWVVIINNAPWSVKPKTTYTDVNGDVVEAPPTAIFIEPSTGFLCETGCKQYILVDSVWNDYNYYVNKQKYQRVGDLQWDLRNTSDWEHMLPGEPPEMRTYKVASDENITDEERDISEEKHLDCIGSWVERLHIGLADFEQRFPSSEKKVQYKGAIHERFAPYSQRDGKVMQLTIFNNDECTMPKVRYEFYENRSDLMRHVKYTYATDQFEEIFAKGRNDSLKSMEYFSDTTQPRKVYFYSASRIDSLDLMVVEPGSLVLHYKGRSDKCWYKEFDFTPSGNVLKKVTEKFHKASADDVGKNDIAIRTFLFQQNKIVLKFHYTFGALTATTVEFTKPPRPDYGKELVYDEKLTKIYKANPLDPTRTNLELYRLLRAQLQYEDQLRKNFEKIFEDINNIFDLRRSEKAEPKLKFSIFDPLRNGAARAIRMRQFEEEEELKKEIASKPADFLAPYLVPYKHQEELTPEQSLNAYNACLNDLKSRFVNLLNNLQRHYEDLTSESKSLNRFLNKFENQFNNYDYKRLVQQSKDLELNKRMVQQRLTLTHEESQKKYEIVKNSLLKDSRLNFKKDDLVRRPSESKD